MVKVTFTLPKEMFEKHKKYCEENDIKLSALYRQGAEYVIKNKLIGKR